MPRSARRVAAVVLASTLLAGGCSGDGDGAEDRDDRPPRPRPGQVSEALAAAGVAVVDVPGGEPINAPAAPAAAIWLWSWQADNLDREAVAGDGYLGSRLDALVGDIDGLPFSALLAAWLSVAPTPIASSAAALIGPQPWDQAPAIVFPTATLVLFVADFARLASDAGFVAADRDGEAEGFARLAGAGEMARAGPAPAAPVTGICSTLTGWVNDVMSTLFDALKVAVEPGSTFGWLGEVWNAAVDLAESLVTTVIETLTAPVVALIADAVAVIGTLSMVASLLQPWSVHVVPDDAVTAFAVGSSDDVESGFTAEADTNLEDPWPDVLVDCANAVGLDLPDPSSASGAEVEWTVAGFPELGEEVSREGVLDGGNSARLEFVTGREDADAGSEQEGLVGASVVVESDVPAELQAMLSQLLTDQVPVEPFGALVAEIFAALTEPVFEQLAELVQVDGAGSMRVIHHRVDPATLYDGSWKGVWFSFSATATGEARTLVPIELDIDGDTVSGAAAVTQHIFNVEPGTTVGGARGDAYALVTADRQPVAVAATTTDVELAGEVNTRYVTDVLSDFDLPPNQFDRAQPFEASFDVEGVTCAAAGALGRGDNFAVGWWLVHDGDDDAEDLVAAGLAVSAAVLDATDLPDRPGDDGRIGIAVARLDDAVESFKASVPSGCAVDPVLQWAGLMRSLATR